MSALSIRKLPEAVEKKLIFESKRRNQTKTQVLIDSVMKGFGMVKKSERKKLIESFFTPSEDDLKNINELEIFLREFNKIDQEMWK